MKGLVSKVRAQKTRTREKQASKASAEALPWKQRPFTGVLIALVLLALTVLVIGSEQIISGHPDPAMFLPLAGKAVMLLAALFAAGVGFKIISPEILKQNSRILLLSIISFLSIVAVKAVLYANGQFTLFPDELLIFLLPLCIAPLITAILLDSKTAVVTAVWVSLANSFLMDNSFQVLIIGIITSVVASQVAHGIKTRSKIVRAGVLIVGSSKIIFVFAATAYNWQNSDFTMIAHQSVACFTSGLASAIAAILLLYLLERPFRITTDIMLFELADLGHPLLQRLAIEAPGTYHHSLVVANLAQAAADEIGANSLLTRICCYYHDVGKLTKPDFFAENINLQENPHDNLPPSMSTLVITAHVKEGLSLAILHKLPPPVLDVIREHHGTSLLTYFHHKAKTQMEFELGQSDESTQIGQTKLDEGNFRYPGPRPSSRESAIICLADPVEAASRTMKKNSAGHIEGMVNEIVMARIRDGQLDDAQMTLEDLTKVKRSFVFTLTNMLHGRVPYPKDEDTDKQQPKAAQGEQQNNKGPDSQNNGQSPKDEAQ